MSAPLPAFSRSPTRRGSHVSVGQYLLPGIRTRCCTTGHAASGICLLCLFVPRVLALGGLEGPSPRIQTGTAPTLLARSRSDHTRGPTSLLRLLSDFAAVRLRFIVDSLAAARPLPS